MKEPNAPPRYGKALLNVAEKLGNVEEVREGTLAVAELVRQQPRLLAFLKVPNVAASAKKEVIRKAFQGQAPEVLVNFLCLLVDRQRVDDLREMIDAFLLAYDLRRGLHPVEVRTAARFPDDLKPVMESRLGELASGPVRVTYVADPNIIGGVIVLVGDTGTDIDGSIQRQLFQIKENLLKVKVV